MSLKIFYIDDELALLEVFKELFDNEGIEILTFVNPKKALEELTKTQPDLIFIDYRLPGITGDELAKSFNPETPKALITGEMNVKTQTKFDRVFPKPFSITELEKYICEHKNKKLVA